LFQAQGFSSEMTPRAPPTCTSNFDFDFNPIVPASLANASQNFQTLVRVVCFSWGAWVLVFRVEVQLGVNDGLRMCDQWLLLGGKDYKYFGTLAKMANCRRYRGQRVFRSQLRCSFPLTWLPCNQTQDTIPHSRLTSCSADVTFSSAVASTLASHYFLT
jgi:hypothetical protein